MPITVDADALVNLLAVDLIVAGRLLSVASEIATNYASTAELPNLAAQAPSPQALGPKVTHYTLSDVKTAVLIQTRKGNRPVLNGSRVNGLFGRMIIGSGDVQLIRDIMSPLP